MTGRAGGRRALLFALCLLAMALGAVVEYAVPVPAGRLAAGLWREGVCRLLYAAAVCAMLGRYGLRPSRAAYCGREGAAARPSATVAVCLIFAVAVNNFPISTLLAGKAQVNAWHALPALVFVCLATALFEELLFRGMLLPLCLSRTGHTRKGVFAAVLLSSAVFGALHLLNLAGGADPGSTLLQVGYSFLIGCACAALCCLHGSLLPPVLFHALYNVGGYLVPRLGTGALYDGPTVIVTVLLGLACFLAVFYALFSAFPASASEKIGKNPQKSKKTQ